MRLIRLLTRGNHGGDTEAVTTSPTAPLGGGRRRAVTAASCAMAAALVAGVFSVVAITTTATVAGASTTPVTATWSSSPNCTSYQTATPPVGTVSANARPLRGRWWGRWNQLGFRGQRWSWRRGHQHHLLPHPHLGNRLGQARLRWERRW